MAVVAYGVAAMGGDTWQVSTAEIQTSTNAPLIVAMTAGATENQLVGDKTCGEVYSAFTAGRSCLISITASGQMIAITSAIHEDNTYVFYGSIGGQSFSTEEDSENEYITVTTS